LPEPEQPKSQLPESASSETEVFEATERHWLETPVAFVPGVWIAGHVLNPQAVLAA